MINSYVVLCKNTLEITYIFIQMTTATLFCLTHRSTLTSIGSLSKIAGTVEQANIFKYFTIYTDGC